ncbi:MAG: chorismate mutase [Actinomycetota bacterium]|nr:chorismate mutase [Actinomycetota bacterium]
MAERIRAIRGATTLDEDTKDQVIDRTGDLLQAIFDRNRIEKADVVSMIFTATGDVRAEFPAAAARQIGLSHVPLLCARELDVQDGVPLCIRVMIHVYLDVEPGEIRHVYLERAKPLRADLPQ